MLFFKEIDTNTKIQKNKTRDKCLLIIIDVNILSKLLVSCIQLYIISTPSPQKVYLRNVIMTLHETIY